MTTHMTLDNGVIEVDISDDMLEEAITHSEDVFKIKKYAGDSIRKGEGTFYGSLGEIIVRDTLGLEHANTFDYDLLLDDIKIEVKTKDRTVPPKLDYEASITRFNPNQDCDGYIFVSLLSRDNIPVKGYIMGYISKEDYFSKCRALKKGDFDPRNNWRAKCDCYNIEYSKIERIGTP